MNEVPLDLPLESGCTLEQCEEYLQAVRSNERIIRFAKAVCLGRVKIDRLHLGVARSFSDYLKLQRTNIPFRTGMHLALCGEAFLRYRDQLEENGIKPSQHLFKLPYINSQLLRRDPFALQRLPEKSVRQWKEYVKQATNVQCTKDYRPTAEVVLSVTRRQLTVDNMPTGIDLHDLRQNVGSGKKALVVYVDATDENAIRRMKRKLAKITA